MTPEGRVGSGSYRCPCGDKISNGSRTMHERGKRHRRHAEIARHEAAGLVRVGAERLAWFEWNDLPYVKGEAAPAWIFVAPGLGAIVTSKLAVETKRAVFKAIGTLTPEERETCVGAANATHALGAPIEEVIATFGPAALAPVVGLLAAVEGRAA